MNPKIETILKELLDSTIDESTYWYVDQKDPFPNETTKKYYAMSNDNLTRFNVDIDISDDFQSIKYRNGIWILNDKLTNGRTYVVSNEYIKGIEQYIFDNQIKPNLIQKDQDSVLDHIATSIGDKSQRREKKITNILSDGFLNIFGKKSD